MSQPELKLQAEPDEYRKVTVYGFELLIACQSLKVMAVSVKKGGEYSVEYFGQPTTRNELLNHAKTRKPSP